MPTSWKSVRNESFCYLDRSCKWKVSVLRESGSGGSWWARLFVGSDLAIDMNLGQKLTDSQARQRACREIAKRLSHLSVEAIKCEEID